MNLPSKELLSEVLKVKVDSNYFGLYGTMIEYDKYGSINIYELQHKCKEWAFWNDHEIVTRMRIPDIYRYEHKIDYGYVINHTNNGVVGECWWLSTEPEAVFLACQWILENR